MSSITTRAGKGSVLTYTEVDSNFTNLNTDKLEKSGGTITGYNEGSVYSVTYASTITPNVANGNNQTVTLTGNVTFSAFASPVAGQSLTLFVTQDATGSRLLTSTMLFAGGTKTLSTTANAVDIIVVFYDGTNYWASLSKDFK